MVAVLETEDVLYQRYEYICSHVASWHKARSKCSIPLTELKSFASEGLLRGLRSYKPSYDTSLTTWLNTKVRSAVLDGIESFIRSKRVSVVSDNSDVGISRLSERARNIVVRQELWKDRSLSARDKQILILVYREQMSVDTVTKLFRKADKTITNEQVNVWLQVAVEKLLRDKPKAISVCCMDGCDKAHFRGGYCIAHYGAMIKRDSPVLKRLPTDKPCLMKNCSNKRYARGFCITHYNQQMEQDSNRIKCSTDGCSRRAIAKGQCSKCYRRQRKYRSKKSV